MYGTLKINIYESDGRYPIDVGEPFTKEMIDDMFSLKYIVGTRLYRRNDGTSADPCFAWYTKDGDDGWAEFYPLNDYFTGKQYHPIISNLKLSKPLSKV